MARINIEDQWWSDLRRSKLSKILGSEYLADAAAIRMWKLAQDFWKNERGLIPIHVWEHFEFAKECVACGLAVIDREPNGTERPFIYVRGSCEYLDWIREKRELAIIAGKKSAESRKKKFGSSQPPGGKGHKQPKNSSINRTEPNENSTEPNPPTLVPVPSPVLDLSLVPADSTKCKKTSVFIAKYCSLFKSRYGTNPEVKGKNSGIAKRISQDLSEEKINLYLEAFFAMPDAWLVKVKHPLATFETKLNEIVVFANTGNFTTTKQVQQADNMATNALLLEQVRKGHA